MENYVKTKNIISNVCNQSGLSTMELSGVLNEVLAELRQIMLANAIGENLQLKEELAKLQAEDETSE